MAATYPVDEEIAELRSKADYLETLKNTLESNHCTIQLDSNVVALVPGALRSEGLVMAVSPGMAGNYLAYHQAPKPEHLKNIIEYTLLKEGAGDRASIVTAHLGLKSDGTFGGLVVVVNEPVNVQEGEEFWMYKKTPLKLPFNTEGKLAGQSGGTTADLKQVVRFTCGAN